MAVIQMTSAQYQAKYGAPPAPSTGKLTPTDVIPSPIKMTRAEYELKYGAPPPGSAPTQLPSAFGNPIQDIKAAGQRVNQAIMGQGEFQGQGAVRRGFSAAENAAMAVPTVAADVVPGGKAVMGAISSGFGAATKFAGNIGNYLASAAEKVGIMTPEQRKQYDKNNAAFAGSPVGQAIESAASVANSAGNISNVILMAHGFAQGAQDLLTNKLPAIKQKLETTNPIPQGSPEFKQQALIKATADEIAAVETKYAKLRNVADYSPDVNASRERIAASGVLKHTVDESGKIQTTNPGGPVDQYRAMTVGPAEGIVRKMLEQEGGKTNLSAVRAELLRQIDNSGLEGADLLTAQSGVERHIAGLRLRADTNGYVPNEVLQDAKLNEYRNINFQTPPEVATARKAYARGYKTLIEDNSQLNIKEVNTELQKFYDDITRLENLHGRLVAGGKLGKYTAQLTGNIVGGIAGSMFGPFGSAISSVIGGEAASYLKGQQMSGSFSAPIEPTAPESPILKEAVSSVGTSAKSSPTPPPAQSRLPSTSPKTSITAPKSKVAPTATIPPELQSLAKEAAKYSSAEEFVKAQSNVSHGGDLVGGIDTTKGSRSFYGKGFYVTDKQGIAGKYGTLNDLRLDTSKVVERSAPMSERFANKLDDTFDFPPKIYTYADAYDFLAKKLGGEQKASDYFAESGIDGWSVKNPTGVSDNSTSYTIFNKDAVQTKSQLTDLYNKVKGKK